MKVSYIFILLSFLLVQCGEGTRDDSKKDDTNEEVPAKKEKEEEVKRLPTHRFVSTEMGVREYMTMRQNDAGDKEWFYSTEKKPKDIKLGVTSKNGEHAVYFLGKPQVLYTIDLSNCGFELTDEEGVTQWYRQLEPECGL